MPFQKGQTGNPGGRPKRINTAQHEAQKHAEAAVAVLVALLQCEKPDVRRRAAVDIIDRAYGKPKEFLGFTDEDDQDLFREITVTVVRATPEGAPE